MLDSRKTALIIGAGSAGLTAARELAQRRRDICPIVAEASGDIGAISCTGLNSPNTFW